MLLYFVLCIVTSSVCMSEGMDIKSWKLWTVMGCIFGSYMCGVFG